MTSGNSDDKNKHSISFTDAEHALSEPGKNDIDPNSLPPTPAPDNKTLHPLFGTYCKTETYSVTDADKNTSQIHCDAYMDDPVAKTWTVAKTVRRLQPSFNPYKRKTITHVHKVKSKVSFKEAAAELARFEAECRKKPAVFAPMFPESASMGFVHFKAFAEREGYIFDTKGLLHARPDEKALPAGFSFFDEDIESANKHLARPANEFDNNGPMSKTPNTHFLLDHFTRAARENDFDSATTSARVLNILDRFVEQVDKAHGKLSEYCRKFQELGQGELISDAEDLLTKAESSVKQLKAYGVDTADFESFVLQCKISCYVLHAEGLYGLMHNGKGDFDANEALFKSRVNQAMQEYKKIDTSDAGLKTLQNMIVQMPEPKVPDAIGSFITRYKQARKDYDHPQPGQAAKDNKPRPPRP
jgi:hypothetical protein